MPSSWRGSLVIKVNRRPVPQFLAGQLYFFVTYCDPQLRYPIVESYVFLGMNLSDEDLDDTWYFQPALDYVRFGSAVENSNRPVLCANALNISEFLDELGLSECLGAALRRRSIRRSP